MSLFSFCFWEVYILASYCLALLFLTQETQDRQRWDHWRQSGRVHFTSHQASPNSNSIKVALPEAKIRGGLSSYLQCLYEYTVHLFFPLPCSVKGHKQCMEKLICGPDPAKAHEEKGRKQLNAAMKMCFTTLPIAWLHSLPWSLHRGLKSR